MKRVGIVLLLGGLLTAAATAAAPIVPPGILVASDRSGGLVVLDRTGQVAKRIRTGLPACCQAIALSRDRRHVYASAHQRTTNSYSVYDVDLASGRAHRLGFGGSVALSPDGRRLAYFSLAYRNDILYRTGIEIRNLGTGASHIVPFTGRVPWGTPPDVQLNWSPDGRRVVVVDNAVAVGADHGLRIVSVDSAPDVESQPGVAGYFKAPVFLDDRTILVLTNCCTGTHQRMEAVNLPTGARTPFAVLPEPPESLRRISPGTFVATTPDGFLLRFSKGRVRRLGTGRYYSVSG
jgi:WD40 repeat protein